MSDEMKLLRSKCHKLEQASYSRSMKDAEEFGYRRALRQVMSLIDKINRGGGDKANHDGGFGHENICT